MRLEFGDRCVTGTYPVSQQIERQLSESGFCRLLKVKSRADASIPSRSVRYIAFKSEQEINAETIAEVRDELLRDDLKMPVQVRRMIFRALSEAMTNVNHHAYLGKQFSHPRVAEKLSGRWWMLASLHTERNRFSLLFYDAGVGIPKTLPRTHTMERIRATLSLLFDPDDGQMLEAAMEMGRSRTKLSHRGKGLLDLARLIDSVGSGELRIYSRTGALVYRPDYLRGSNHDGFVEGTLIEWRLPFTGAVETIPEESHEDVDG